VAAGDLADNVQLHARAASGATAEP